jgi:hypothetical protein
MAESTRLPLVAAFPARNARVPRGSTLVLSEIAGGSHRRSCRPTFGCARTCTNPMARRGTGGRISAVVPALLCGDLGPRRPPSAAAPTGALRSVAPRKCNARGGRRPRQDSVPIGRQRVARSESSVIWPFRTEKLTALGIVGKRCATTRGRSRAAEHRVTLKGSTTVC